MITIGEQLTADAQTVIDASKTEVKSLVAPVVNVTGYVSGDGVADDIAGLEKAAADALAGGYGLFVPPHLSVRITRQANLKGIRYIRAEGTITYDGPDEIGVIAGYDARSTSSVELYFANVVHTDPSKIALRLVGLKNAFVTVNYSNYVQLYADEAQADIYSIAYSTFRWGKVDKLELMGAPGISWINENVHIGGRFKEIRFAGAYSHNQNVFIKPCVEGAESVVNLETGHCNTFYDARTEYGTSLVFGAGTWRNYFLDRFQSNPINILGLTDPSTAKVMDNGDGNVYLTVPMLNMNQRSLLRLDASTRLFDASCEMPVDATKLTPGLEKLYVGTWKNVVDFVLPIDQVREFYLESDATLWRPVVWCYDQNMVLLSSQDAELHIQGSPWNKNADGSYNFLANLKQAWLNFNIDKNVKYARIQVNSGNAAGSFKYLTLTAYAARTLPDAVVDGLVAGLRRGLFQAAAPTKGAGRPGDVIGKTSGGVFVCQARTDARLTVAAEGGAGTITLDTVAGITIGDIIGVALDDGKTHWTTVNGAPAGNTVNLTAALPSAAAVGRLVVTNRWA